MQLVIAIDLNNAAHPGWHTVAPDTQPVTQRLVAMDYLTQNELDQYKYTGRRK